MENFPRPEPKIERSTEDVFPLAVITRNLIINKHEVVAVSFPIFKVKPKLRQIINSLKAVGTHFYGVVEGNKVIVYDRKNYSEYRSDDEPEKPVATTNYAEIASEPSKVFTPHISE